jgi:hypothetical protein
LFEHQYKIEGGNLLIKAGQLPTPGPSALIQLGGKKTCA